MKTQSHPSAKKGKARVVAIGACLAPKDRIHCLVLPLPTLKAARSRMRFENMDAAAKIEALAEAQYEADRTPDVEPSWKEITRKDPRSYVRHTFLTRARAILRVIEGES